MVTLSADLSNGFYAGRGSKLRNQYSPKKEDADVGIQKIRSVRLRRFLMKSHGFIQKAMAIVP